jgi:hypothetical protein
VHSACQRLLGHIGSELVPLQGWATADGGGRAMALVRFLQRAETGVRDLIGNALDDAAD